MTAVVIDGKKKALEIRENLAREIAEAKARPVLAGWFRSAIIRPVRCMSAISIRPPRK